MDNKNYSKAKILILITAVVFAVSALILVPLTISYFSTGSDVTAIALIFFGSAILIVTTVPCLLMAVFGTVSAAKAEKEGIAKARRLFVIGAVETVIYGIAIFGMIIAVILSILAVTG